MPDDVTCKTLPECDTETGTKCEQSAAAPGRDWPEGVLCVLTAGAGPLGGTIHMYICYLVSLLRNVPAGVLTTQLRSRNSDAYT